MTTKTRKKIRRVKIRESWYFTIKTFYFLFSIWKLFKLRFLVTYNAEIRNKQVKLYDMSGLHLLIENISCQYRVTVSNKFDTRQETSERYTPNDEYEYFVNDYIEAAAGCIPTKPRTKCRVLWEAIAVKEKRDNIKKHLYIIKKQKMLSTET